MFISCRSGNCSRIVERLRFLSRQLRASGQRTVLQFFSPSQTNKTAASDDTNCSITEDSSWSSPCSTKKARNRDSFATEEVVSVPEDHAIVIESDLEEAEENSIQTETVSFRVDREKLSKKHCSRGKHVNLSSKKRKLETPTSFNMKSAKWNCVHCTFLNHPLIDFCEMCSSKKENGCREEVDSVIKGMPDVSRVSGMKAHAADSTFLPDDRHFSEGGTPANETTSNSSEPQLVNDTENDCLAQLMKERSSGRYPVGYHTSTPTRKTDRSVLMALDESNAANKSTVSNSSYASVADETANFDLCSDWDLSQDDTGDVSQDGASSTAAGGCREGEAYRAETASYVISDNNNCDDTDPSSQRDISVLVTGQFLYRYTVYLWNSCNILSDPNL